MQANFCCLYYTAVLKEKLWEIVVEIYTIIEIRRFSFSRWGICLKKGHATSDQTGKESIPLSGCQKLCVKISFSSLQAAPYIPLLRLSGGDIPIRPWQRPEEFVCRCWNGSAIASILPGVLWLFVVLPAHYPSHL